MRGIGSNKSAESVASISGRLAGVPDLRLPVQLTRNGEVGVSERLEYVCALLQRDPGVFLERHGEHLLEQELVHFEALRSDHEVDFHLKALEVARGGGLKSAPLIRNRRLAAMQRLLAEGHYFSEAAMEQRQPWLFHQYIGRHRPSADASPPLTDVSPGLAYAERLLDRAREATLADVREEQQHAYDDAASEESGEDEPEAVDGGGGRQQSPAAAETLPER